MNRGEVEVFELSDEIEIGVGLKNRGAGGEKRRAGAKKRGAGEVLMRFPATDYRKQLKIKCYQSVQTQISGRLANGRRSFSDD